MKMKSIALVIASLASAALFAGEYDDLTVPSQAGVNEISGSPTYAGVAPSGAFSNLSGSNGRFLTTIASNPAYIIR